MVRFLLLVVVALVASVLLGSLIAGEPAVSYYATADPVLVVSILALSLALVSFFFGIATGDYSWVDRLWSVAPVVFVWFYALRYGMPGSLLLIAVLVTLWGARLTFNFARKGGYAGVEDYRWPILRDRIGNPLLWQVFHFGFISLFQVGLFVLFTAPVWAMAERGASSLTIAQAGSCALLLCFLLIETVGDQQQWRFQEAKRRSAGASASFGDEADADLERGFLTSGLFRYSRHPNYLGELGVWWSVYLFTRAGSGQLLHWTILGPAVLTLLFIGSTRFTEEISASKYPDYASYQATTAPIVPWPRALRGFSESAHRG